ncbi:MAG: class A beta-lactamase-related serine hydrolase [Anaerolineae bacterium]|nr:class A beta-lactamase-related serine hydrolase [Anaerolineae bacterium]MDW8173237.1 serine hydrolase [Anaerolineae bacterium]
MIRLTTALLSLFLLMIQPAQAQTSALSALPDCGFAERIAMDGLRVGAVVLNLENGQGCAESLDERFQVASVMKLFVAGAYLERANLSLSPQQRVLTFTREYWMAGRDDCLRREDIGRSYDYLSLISLMIGCSDNAATWMLMDALGWGTVQDYVRRHASRGAGEVLPYAEVDKRKLILSDSRWRDVPTVLASRFYRVGMTEGLGEYLNPLPQRLHGQQYNTLNARYFRETESNTATPRAIAEYLIYLHLAAQNGGWANQVLAQRMFAALLTTPRQYSMESAPADWRIGSKDGLDRGIAAEANIVFTEDDPLRVRAVVVVFLQQTRSDSRAFQLPTRPDSPLNVIMRQLSGIIMGYLG